MTTLHRDYVQQKISTWGDAYDFDMFASSSFAYEDYNSTHTKVQTMQLARWSSYNGKVEMSASSDIQYFPKQP